MSEIGTKPGGTDNNLANLDWAELAAGGRVVEPAPASRNPGWVLNQEPPSNWVNWFWRLAARAIVWMTAGHVRAFTDLESATGQIGDPSTPLVEGEVFRVDYRTGIQAPLSEAWGQAGAALTATRIVSDGEWVYYAQGQTLYRASRTDGVVATSRDLGAAINDISTDGGVVCATTDNQAGTELFCVDRLTLADSAGFPLAATGNGGSTASNGFRVCYSDASTFVQIINESTGLTIASPNYSAAVYDLCVDYERLYVTGDDAGAGVQLKAFALSNGALAWQSTLEVTPSGNAVMNAIVADGERIYVGGTATAVGGGVFWSLAALSREDGSRVWRVDTGGNDVEAIAVDEQYVWAVDNNETLWQFTRDMGTLVKTYAHGANLLGVDTDADAVFLSGDTGTGGNRLRRLHRGNPSKAYVIADGFDPNRRPFHKLAIPGDKL